VRDAPLRRYYPAHILLVVCSLFPGLINTVAFAMIAPHVGVDLGGSQALLAAVPLAADAALAFGSILSAEVSRRVDGRNLFVCLLAVSFVSAACEATATHIVVFVAALLVHALAAGMLLIVALPPMLTTFGAKRLPPTGLILVASLFGSVTLGPVVGSVLDGPSLWRTAFAGDTIVALVALVLALFTLAPRPAAQPLPAIDWYAICVASISTLLIFTGVFRLETTGWLEPHATIPFALGVCGYVVLIVGEFLRRDGLVPVRALLGSLALAGACATVVGNACYAATADATIAVLTRVDGEPLRVAGLALWPGVLGAVAGAFVFARVMTTRWVVVLGAVGLVFSGAAAVLALRAQPFGVSHAQWVIFAAAFGAGLTIVPGLFLIALSIERAMLGRAMALLNLLRLTGGFIAGPGVAHTIYQFHLREGIDQIYETVVVAAAVGIVVIATILRIAHAPLRDPDLAAFDAGHAALVSPRI